MQTNIEAQLPDLLKEFLHLEASAGTGKTYTITKIIKFLAENSNLSRVFVITYTEKATRELELRIQTELENLKENHFNTFQIENIFNNIQIGTIHQFCRNILYQNSQKLSISSHFSEIKNSTILYKQIFENCWKKIEKKKPEKLRIILQIIPFRKIKEFFISSFTASKGFPFKINQASSSLNILQSILTSLKLKENELILFKNFFIQNNSTYSLAFTELIDNCINFSIFARDINSHDFIKHLNDLIAIIQSNFLTEKLILNKNIEKFILKNKLLFGLDILIFNLYQSLNQIKSILLIEQLNDLINFFYNEKKEFCLSNDFLTTDELIEQTFELLQSNSNIKNKIQNSIEYLIIDECQDINVNQMNLFKLIFQEKKHGLIFVGDPKQSIYRFQSSDIDSYYSGKTYFKGNFFRLDETRRTDSHFTIALNQIFENLFSLPTSDPRIQYLPIHSALTNSNPIEPIHVVGIKENLETQYLATIEEIEWKTSFEICNWILEIISNKHYKIFDKNENKYTTIQFRDITILTLNRDTKILENCLIQNNIPYIILKNRFFLQEPLVLLSLELLECFKNPNNEFSFKQVLLSEFFSIPTQILDKEYNLNYLSEAKNDNLNKIYIYFMEANQKKDKKLIGNLLAEFFEKTDIYVNYFSNNHQNKISKLKKFIGFLNLIQLENGFSFYDTLHYVKTQSKENSVETEEISNQNSIKITTIHSSKGLEYPVVILYNLFKDENKSKKNYFIQKSNLQLILDFKIDEIETFSFKNLQVLEKKKLDEEKIRLLYVALTRAKDFLLIPFFQKEKQSKSSLISILHSAFNKELIQNLINSRLMKIHNIKNSNHTTFINSESRIKNSFYNESKLPNLLDLKVKEGLKIISYSSLENKERNKVGSFTKETITHYSKKDFAAKFGEICHSMIEKVPIELIQNPSLGLKNELTKISEISFFQSGLIFKKEIPIEYTPLEAIELCYNSLTKKYTIGKWTGTPSSWNHFQREIFFYNYDELNHNYFFKGIGDGYFMLNDQYYIVDWKTNLLPNYSINTILEKVKSDYMDQLFLYSFHFYNNLTWEIKNQEIIRNVWDEKFGGMLFVFLREKNDHSGTVLLKPTLEELLQFQKRFQNHN